VIQSAHAWNFANIIQYVPTLNSTTLSSVEDLQAPTCFSTTDFTLPTTNPTNTHSQYTNQSRGGTGVRSWASRKDPIVDTDLVVFVQFGINHVSFACHALDPPSHSQLPTPKPPALTACTSKVPRIEDFPVMPCEILKVSFKPVNFFTRNPAIDVPPSTQDFNKSTLLASAHQQGADLVAEVDAKGCVGCEAKESSKL
jgi:primary-amine oxidase